MEMMNELIEKYFRGETSLAEEKDLKQYFSTGNVSPELEIYRNLFSEFVQELNEKALFPIIKELPIQRKMKRVFFQSFMVSGIAAMIVLLLWVQLSPSTTNYTIIGGTRIDNKEFAQRYAAKKLSKVNAMMAKTMDPLKSFNKVRANIEPLKNISDIRLKMDDIQNKLQIK
jgi:hypothetical protein